MERAAVAFEQLVEIQTQKAIQAAELPGSTDPKTRPDFQTATNDSTERMAIDDERFAPLKKTVVQNPITGKYEQKTTGGFSPMPLTDHDRASINVHKFPRGDYDNFSLTRYAYAKQNAEYGIHSSSWMHEVAPWETQYYEAGRNAKVFDPITKAQGDMVSGQDGGFLAPEFWSQNFFDQLYATQSVTQLPITTMRMGTRVTHMPKLTAAIAVSYSNENSALATTQAQFAQLSFTARKQGQIIQISNELIRDSVPAADQILQQHAVRWMALDRDKQLILGNGQAGAPIGLWNIGGAAVQNSLGIQNTTLTTNASPLYTELTTGIINVETLNSLSTNVPLGMATCTGVLGMPALKQQIINMKDSNGRPMFDFQGLNALRGSFPAGGGGQFDGLYGVPTWRFSQVFNQAANSRYITFGDWQWLIYMVRQDVEVMVSNVAGTAFAADQTWIRLISRYDVGVAHPEAFFGYTNG